MTGTHGGQKKALETGVTASCKLLCGCCELNPGSPEEQSVLLTTVPFLQPHPSKGFYNQVCIC